MKAVRFDEYGGVDVLEVREVEDPIAGPGEVLVAVKAAGINPGEIAIREGRLHQRWPATFPSGEGTDLAGVVRALGAGVSAFAVGHEVLGWTDRGLGRGGRRGLGRCPARAAHRRNGDRAGQRAQP
jgi:NADPH:quinone reductase-like Zn-dependent oxidoreductase